MPHRTIWLLALLLLVGLLAIARLVNLGCIAPGHTDRGSGVLSLLDQVGELETAGPWSVAAFVRARETDRQKHAIAGPSTDGSVSYSLMRRTALDLPGKTTVLIRVTYPRRWGSGGTIELLMRSEDTIVARGSAPLGASWQSFRLLVPPGGADALELQCRLPQDTEVPPMGIVALAMDPNAEIGDWRRATALLAWAARQPPDVALVGLKCRRFHLVREAASREIMAVTAGDSFTFEVPETFRGGRLEFEALRLRVNAPSKATLRLDVRTTEQWQAMAAWKVEDLAGDGEGRCVVKLSTGGDGIRFSLVGTDEVIGICTPLIRPRHTSGDATNLVLIDLDTMRADRLGCYGYATRPTSERLDSLLEAKGFVVFRSALSGGPYTISATPKFLASRFTNIHAGESVPRENLMLAEMLRTNGYYCAAFTGGAVLRCPGFAQGFHEYHFTKGIGKSDDVFPPAGRWLVANRTRPFFLFIHTYETHVPYTRDVFCRQLPHGRLGDVSMGEQLLAGVTQMWDRASGVLQLTAEESLYVQAAYDGGVRIAADAAAGFLSMFDRLGLWGNTVVVILSDHGEEFWEHTGAFAYHSERSVYNELLRVPFMVREPDATQRGIRFIDQAVSTVDLAPTVLHLLRLSVSNQFDGEDLVPVIEGGMTRRAIPVIATNDPGEETPRACVFANGMKYIAPDSVHPMGELFDLASDPAERFDLTEQRPLDREELSALLDRALQAAGRPVPASSDSVHALPDELRAQLRMLGYLDRD